MPYKDPIKKYENNKNYRLEHPKERALSGKNYRDTHKDEKSEYDKKWWKEHKWKVIVMDQQKGICPICRNPLDGKINIDHDHKTGNVRGILHPECNLLVGHVETSYKNVGNALKYIGEAR